MKLLVCIILLTGLIACRTDNTPLLFGDEQKLVVTTSARQTLNEYYAAVKQKGLAAEFAYLDSSADFFWVPPGYTAPISYDSVVASLTLAAPRFRAIENVWDSLRIVPLSPTLASYTGKIHSTMQDSTGQITTTLLIETGVIIKRETGWKLLNGQTAFLSEKINK